MISFVCDFLVENSGRRVVADDGHGGNRYRSTLRTKYRSLAALLRSVLRAGGRSSASREDPSSTEGNNPASYNFPLLSNFLIMSICTYNI